MIIKYSVSRFPGLRSLWNLFHDSCNSTDNYSAGTDAQIYCTHVYSVRAGKCGGTFDGRRNIREWSMEMGVSIQVCHLFDPRIMIVVLITTWTISAPAGFLASVVIIFTLPSASDLYLKVSNKKVGRRKLSLENLRRIDYIGVGLLLAASILLVFAVESAGIDYGWSSVTIIATLVLGGVLSIAFISWELWLQQRPVQIPEPIFPPRILKSRLMASMFAYVVEIDYFSLLKLMRLTTNSYKCIIFSRFPIHLRRSQHTAEGPSSICIQLPTRRCHTFTSFTYFSIGYSDFWAFDIKRKSTPGLSRYCRSSRSNHRHGFDLFTTGGYFEFST